MRMLASQAVNDGVALCRSGAGRDAGAASCGDDAPDAFEPFSAESGARSASLSGAGATADAALTPGVALPLEPVSPTASASRTTSTAAPGNP